MNARSHVGWAAALTLSAGLAHGAQPSAAGAPTMRTVNTPAGPMLELTVPPAPVRAASAPLTDVQSTPAGPMLLLRQPTTASSARKAVASTTTSFPANARAEALPNGAQVLVLPTREPPAAPIAAAPPVVEIDPAKTGTRVQDAPRNDVLYRQKPVAPSPTR